MRPCALCHFSGTEEQLMCLTGEHKRSLQTSRCYLYPFKRRPHVNPSIPFVRKFAENKLHPRLQNPIALLYSDQCAPRFYAVSEWEDKKAEVKEGGGGWTAYFLDANCMRLCGCLTCVALIIAEHGVAFDSGVTLTARRLAEASWMTEDQRRQAGKQKSSREKIRRGTTSTGGIVKVRYNFFLSFFFTCENFPPLEF